MSGKKIFSASTHLIFLLLRYGVPICPHAGGVRLCEYGLHLSLIDYIIVCGTMGRNVLE